MFSEQARNHEKHQKLYARYEVSNAPERAEISGFQTRPYSPSCSSSANFGGRVNPVKSPTTLASYGPFNSSNPLPGGKLPAILPWVNTISFSWLTSIT